MSETIGFVGVGRMGSRMASNLLEAGFDVVAYDLDPDRVDEMESRGASVADSLDALAAASDVVVTSLPTVEAVESVYLGDDGLLASLADGSIVIETSTVPPGIVEEIATALEDRDVQLVDCPVIGPPPEAAAGTLTIVAACDRAAFERVEPILEHLGNRVERFEEPGDAKRVKLANNVMTYGNFAIAAEMIALVDRIGIDPERFFEITDSGAAGSAIAAAKAPKAFDGDFEPGFTVDGAREDLRYGLGMKESEDFPAPIAAAVAEQYALGSAMTDGEDDYSVLIEVFRTLGR